RVFFWMQPCRIQTNKVICKKRKADDSCQFHLVLVRDDLSSVGWASCPSSACKAEHGYPRLIMDRQDACPTKNLYIRDACDLNRIRIILHWHQGLHGIV